MFEIRCERNTTETKDIKRLAALHHVKLEVSDEDQDSISFLVSESPDDVDSFEQGVFNIVGYNYKYERT